MEVGFDIASEPVPASRPRVARYGTYYPKKHTTYAEFLKTYLKEQNSLNFEGPVAVKIMFVMPPYKTSDHPVHRADIDNLTKLPLDAMTKTVNDDGTQKFWVDDCFVVHLNALKRFTVGDEQPHTKIIITPISETPEEYCERIFHE